MPDYDAIVIGGGHNGLVTALYLAHAGWKTLVLERNARLGGAVMSDEVTLPGFIHDLYSTNQNLFLNSAVFREFGDDLKRHGLRYRTSAKPYGNVFPGGKSLRVYQDAERTLELLRQHNARDAEGWKTLHDQFHLFAATLLPLLSTTLPSRNAAAILLSALRSAGLENLLEMAQIILSSTRELGEAYFVSEEARALVASWGMHIDFGPDVSGGAMFPFVESFGDMEAGISIVEGGASRMIDALAGLINENGGDIRTDAEVARILTEGDTAVGVELVSGERIAARRAVVANQTPTLLFQGLLRDHRFAPSFRRKVERYQYGPGTMMVHLALRDRLEWEAGEDLHEFAYIHVGPYVDDLARTYTSAISGYLPESPFLVVGQTTAVDPTRAPEGQHVLWIQVRMLPGRIQGDAAGQIEGRDWDAIKEAYADRVLDKLQAYAPNLRDVILDRAVFSPLDLERANPNLVGGDSVAGSHHLRQNFVFRPFPGWSTYEMPLDRLYMVGAATWPGAGINAGSGYFAAQRLLAEAQGWRSTLLKAGAGAGAVAGAVVAARRLSRRG